MAIRKSIPNETKLRLFSASAGHCQKPDCLKPLFPAEIGGDKHIAEMAHVIPHGNTGPRHEERPAEEFEADSFENLILLCPTCHTIIDKAPESFPRSMILEWRSNHLAALAHKQGIIRYENRRQAREAVVAAMDENKAIWKEFAPVEGARSEFNPESETAQIWSQRMKSVILPNHFQHSGDHKHEFMPSDSRRAGNLCTIQRTCSAGLSAMFVSFWKGHSLPSRYGWDICMNWQVKYALENINNNF